MLGSIHLGVISVDGNVLEESFQKRELIMDSFFLGFSKSKKFSQLKIEHIMLIMK